jgi:hypothetical protein
MRPPCSRHAAAWSVAWPAVTRLHAASRLRRRRHAGELCDPASQVGVLSSCSLPCRQSDQQRTLTAVRKRDTDSLPSISKTRNQVAGAAFGRSPLETPGM